MNVLKALLTHLNKDRQLRFRDRRANYVTDAMKCKRDLYWERTGVPETNPTDLVGRLKMMLGSFVEKGLLTDVVSFLHLEGVHYLGTQIPVGGSNPNYDGSLDAMLVERGMETPYVLEIKTKYGAGADYFLSECNPGDEYLSQMGLYLRDLSAKKGITKGCFLFILLSDKNFGVLVQVDCGYDPATGIITAYQALLSNGDAKSLSHSYDVNKSIERLKKIEAMLTAKQEPAKGDYQYKYPVTEETLRDISDYKLRAAINGDVVLGDWQPKYSRYKDKQLAADKQSMEYTESERALLVAEYKRRHPKSKVA